MAALDVVSECTLRGRRCLHHCRFTYQLLQGYDFVHLNRQHGVRMQVPAHAPCVSCASVREHGVALPTF